MPEFFEIDLSLWIKDSDEQEGGFIDPKTIAMLSRLGVTLSFGFYTRNDAQPCGAGTWRIKPRQAPDLERRPRKNTAHILIDKCICCSYNKK